MNQNYPNNVSYIPSPTNSYPPIYPGMGAPQGYPQPMQSVPPMYPSPPPPYPSLPHSTNVPPIYPPANDYNYPKF